MLNLSAIHPDHELRDYLQGMIYIQDSKGAMKAINVYGDWERPTNEIPSDFVVVMHNGDIGGVGMDTPYADGYLMVSLYCKLNDDGSVKVNRVEKILDQFDELIENLITDHYFYRYDAQRFITPTAPNVTSGYSVTNLNLRWNTTSNFNQKKS